MNIFKNKGIACFVVQHEGLSRIREHGRPKLRQSILKLYLFLCYRASGGAAEPNPKEVFQRTGLTKNPLTRARTELVRLKLIDAALELGQGGTYSYTILNLRNAQPFDPKAIDGSAYFQVPTVTLFIDALMRDNKVSSLVYLSVLAEGNRFSTPLLNFRPKKLAALSCVTPETLRSALPILISGDAPLMTMIDQKVEILDPYTGGSLSEAGGGKDEAFWHLSKGKKRVAVQELLTPENFVLYYTEELPDLVPGRAQQDVRCPFHSDSDPSMSVNLDDGTWFCHACVVGGGMRDFEMKKLDTENKAEAWRAICARFGVRFLGRQRRTMTDEHVYKDDDGHSVSKLRRYEDGSGCWYYSVGGKWKLGRGGRKRIPYNLPDLRKAAVVIITEGERKADILRQMPLFDDNKHPVAVTCTGSWNSWKPELVEYFRNKRVLVFRDSDEKGQRYADTVAGSLKHAGIPVDVVEFSRYGKDVRDFMRNHNLEELVDYVGSDWLEKSAEQTVTVHPFDEI